jgi:hypothetical protein
MNRTSTFSTFSTFWSLLRRLPIITILVMAAAANPVRAQAPSGPGLVLSAAVGRSDYSLDCFGAFICSAQPSGTFSKLGVGYEFGTFGIEAWYMNFGRSDAFASFGSNEASDRVQIQAAVVDAAWRWRFGPLETALRVGLASVQHRRTGESNTQRFSPHFGLGLGLAVTPAVTLELGWDITSGKGSSGYGTLVNANSLALRVRL